MLLGNHIQRYGSGYRNAGELCCWRDNTPRLHLALGVDVDCSVARFDVADIVRWLAFVLSTHIHCLLLPLVLA
jgi:hypothetical protein